MEIFRERLDFDLDRIGHDGPFNSKKRQKLARFFSVQSAGVRVRGLDVSNRDKPDF